MTARVSVVPRGGTGEAVVPLIIMIIIITKLITITIIITIIIIIITIVSRRTIRITIINENYVLNSSLRLM